MLCLGRGHLVSWKFGEIGPIYTVYSCQVLQVSRTYCSFNCQVQMMSAGCSRSKDWILILVKQWWNFEVKRARYHSVTLTRLRQVTLRRRVEYREGVVFANPKGVSSDPVSPVSPVSPRVLVAPFALTQLLWRSLTSCLLNLDASVNRFVKNKRKIGFEICEKSGFGVVYNL